MLDDQYDRIEEQNRAIDVLYEEQQSRQALIAQLNEQQVKENMVTQTEKSQRDETFSIASSKFDRARNDSQQKVQFFSLQVLEQSDADMQISEHFLNP